MTETLLPRQNGTDKARLEMKRAVQLPRRKLPLTCLGPLVGLLGAFTTLNFREPVFAQRAQTDERERIAYLRSLAVLSEFEGDTYRAVEHLHEARALAVKIGLPGELWQIQCKIGELHERCRKTEEARAGFSRAAQTLGMLAGNIGDEKLREGFLSAARVRRVLERN